MLILALVFFIIYLFCMFSTCFSFLLHDCMFWSLLDPLLCLLMWAFMVLFCVKIYIG